MPQITQLLPAPWRLLFMGQPELRSDDPFYQRLAQYAATPYTEMPLDALDVWNVDCATGTFTATTSDDDELTAKAQILGTHNGATFLWANSNPSIDPEHATLAAANRKALGTTFPYIAQSDEITIGRRDASTLLSFGAELTHAEMIFIGSSRDTAVLMTLANVRQQLMPTSQSAEAQSVDAGFSLSDLIQAVNTQWQQHLLPPQTLLGLEPDLTAAKALYDAEQIDACRAAIAQIKGKMEPHPSNQEPAGWVFLCDALCALALGDTKQAEEALNIAKRAVIPPTPTRTLLAGARCGIWSESRIIGAYIADPDLFVTLATPAEQDHVRSALVTAVSGRCEVADDPVKVVQAANAERYAGARQAWNIAEAARTQRKESHILCDADNDAEEENAANLRNLMLRWFTPKRSPSAASIGSDPHENPDLCEDITLEAQTNETATLIARYASAWGGETKDHYRYVLERKRIPLSNDICWRISEIWSLWDEGDIRLE